MPPQSKVYRREHTVAFADVDAAGIVYYPRLLHICHLTFEEFFSDVGDLSYSKWILDQRLGFPTVHLDVDFSQPVRYGSPLTMVTTIQRVGKRSVTFRFVGELADGSTAFRADVTKACVGMDSGASQMMPQALLDLFSEFLQEATP